MAKPMGLDRAAASPEKGRTPTFRQGRQDAPPVQCSGFCDLDHSLEPEGLSELRVGVTHAAHGATEGHPMPSGVRGAPARHWGADDPQSRQRRRHTARHNTEGSRTQPSAARGGMRHAQRGVAEGPSLTARVPRRPGVAKGPSLTER